MTGVPDADEYAMAVPVDGAGEDAIAVIGLAGRLPGAADIGEFLARLRAGVGSLRRYSDAELADAGVPPELRADPRHVPVAGHLADLAGFDAELFGYPPEEAARIDPQHRLFLECAWWALEDAGYDPGRVDSPVAVFGGAALNRYLLFHLMAGEPGVPGDWESRLVPGSGADHLTTRVSYKLGLTGPSVAVQTACSSSLVAVCLAAQSLLDFRCDLALAGGAAVTSTLPTGYLATPAGLTSPTGTCRPFDRRADGTVYGNGAAVVVLKRLPDAVADGDHIEAVLRGWAVGNDGADRAGYAVPGVAGPALVVAEAVAVAGVEAADIGYVEAHGTGTALGDELELAALATAYEGATRPAGWLVGSVKAALGNLDAAAGVVGLVAASLAVRDGIVAPTGGGEPSAALPAGFRVTAASIPWPACDPVRRAGVSSFGLGGTNAHVIVEQPPAPTRRTAAAGAVALPVSAAGPVALSASLNRLADHLAATGDAWLADVGYTLALGRRELALRTVVLLDDPHDVVGALRAAAGAPAGVYDVRREPVDDRLGTLAASWVAGRPVDWSACYDGLAVRRVSLPGYPFQRARHWVDPPGQAGSTTNVTASESSR